MTPCFCCLVLDDGPSGVLEEIARACSPRVQPAADGRAVIFDAAGLDRAIGSPAEIGAAVLELAAARGANVRVALSRTTVAAWLLAHARTGVTIAAGSPAEALAALPLGWLAALPSPGPQLVGPNPNPSPRPPEADAGTRARRSRGSARHYRMAPGPALPADASQRSLHDERRVAAERDVVAIFERWGIRTLGDLARLPRGDIHARTGPAGVRLHAAACGEDAEPLVPEVERARFCERLGLDWPVEGLEPLSFVLARLCDALSRALERADRGAVTVTTRLALVSRTSHTRTLHLPAPMRDAKVLRTLILLDLESHPPEAGIDTVEIELDVVPGRIVQGSLLTRALPSPEDLATLTARLQALMGESHVGAPALVETHDERPLAMRPFMVPGSGPRLPARPRGGSRATASPLRMRTESSDPPALGAPAIAVRRLRRPVPARVTLERGVPVRVQPSSRTLGGGRVRAAAGPWRSSGGWWALGVAPWDRDEWDVEVEGGGCYRIARVRASGTWEIDAVLD